MSFLKEIKGWLGLDPDSITPANQVNKENPLFVHIKIPADLGPMDRGEQFEDPLQDALEKEGLGTITGGGSQLSHPDEDGRRTVDYCGIDVDLSMLLMDCNYFVANSCVCKHPQTPCCFMSLMDTSGKSLSIEWRNKK